MDQVVAVVALPHLSLKRRLIVVLFHATMLRSPQRRADVFL
jgi:hypothetical protein